MFPSSFTYSVYIDATPERVWQALTDAEDTKRYFFGTSALADGYAGGRFRIFRPDGKTDVDGKILAWDTAKKLSYTWEMEMDTNVREQPTDVTFTLETVGNTTKLTLVHDHLIDADWAGQPGTFRGLQNGWPVIVSSLKTFLETGKTLEVM